MPKGSLICFELNEVPFTVFDRFCKSRPDSWLTGFLKRCNNQYHTHHETDAVVRDDRPVSTQDLEAAELSPTRTWPSIHRGVRESLHGICDWNQDITELDEKYPPIWHILSSHDVTSGVFGSMQSYSSLPSDRDAEGFKSCAFYVPDFFSPDDLAHPLALRNFQNFNLAMTSKSGRNVSRQIEWRSALSMLTANRSLGIKCSTLSQLAYQLAIEPVKPWLSTRRRTHQVSLAFDVFFQMLEKTRPSFTTFFSNNVAAAMHRYWAAAFPEDYDVYEIEDTWRQTYCDEIYYALEKCGTYLRRLQRFVDHNPNYRLVVISGLGQFAKRAKLLRTQLLMYDFPKFMHVMGIDGNSWKPQPTMLPIFNAVVCEDKVSTMDEALDNLVIGDAPLCYRQHHGGQFAIHLGHRDLDQEHVVFRGQKVPLSELGLVNTGIEDKSDTTGYHVAGGSLLFYDPTARTQENSRRTVSTLDIAPSILEFFEIDPPDYMSRGRVSALSRISQN